MPKNENKRKTIIGIPKEIKNNEFRVGATPYSVKAFVDAGHEVWVEKNAGEKIGFSDAMYQNFGAKIAASPKEIFSKCEMIIKVKEPLEAEFPLLQEGQILFTYLHLAPDPEQTKQILKRKIIGIAYETVTDSNNRLPLLIPMSEVAGRMSIQVGASALQLINGGKGVLLGGIPGVRPARVLVFGGGTVGTEALRVALGFGADVTVFDKSLTRLRQLDELYGPRLKTLFSTPAAIEEAIQTADLIIGAVLVPGGKAPKLITKESLKKMEPGTVIVDVAIDQGGFTETSKPTTHSNPTYIVDGIVHYCVANMPGAVARTSTLGLTNATLPYALKLANLGYAEALLEDPGFLKGLNVFKGLVTNENVAKDLGYEYVPAEKVLKESYAQCVSSPLSAMRKMNENSPVCSGSS
jgi:alanine dehydrogenase